ncbi:MAG TPA: phage tail tape measure protein, partial [Lentisphaeria bacterium]|nr:phage tail tape measure protein [Lentisphaeria bacterium]
MSIALQAIVSLDKSAFSAGLSGLSQAVSNVTGAMSMAFGGVASEILMMAKAFGPFGAAVAVMKDAVSLGANFEQQMANISSVSGLTGEELRKVEIATRDLAKTTRFTATEAGDAMYSLASAGITGADALSNTLKPALLLAGATLSSTQTATEAMTAALANFQIPAAEAGRIADQFAGAIATSPATMERMSEAMKYAGPAAAGFGVALERTVAEVAAFHQVGLRGEMAGTSFRMALVQLSESAAKTGSEVGNALKGWDASTEGVTGAVRRLNSAGVDTAKVIAELGARAGPGMAALMKYGADSMEALAQRIQSAADVSKMYETQLGTLSGRFAIFKSAVEEVWLRLSGALTPALTELAKQATSAVDWIGNLAQALIEGKWQEAAEQVKALWESVKAGAMAFDWVGLFEDFCDLLQVVVQRIVEFGSKLMEQLGLTRTLSALKSAFDTVREAVTLLFSSVGRLAGQMRDVRWADVAKAAIAALDSALSFLLKTIDASLSAVIWIIEQWQALSGVTKTVVLSLVGGAGLVVALTRLIASMMSAATATIAFGVAQKANLISMAETAYIKMLLLRDAISSVTLAQAGMVAGAAVVGVALGTLIRQIPGVADACDKAAIAMAKFLGLHEVEDEALKRRAAELKKQRQAQLAAMEAQEAANKAAREGIAVAADMTDAENEQLIAAWEQQN